MFDDWYENYKRDGGELLLFNTIDLQAAYKAGGDASKILLIQLFRACPDVVMCENFHHKKADRHQGLETCPPLDRYVALLDMIAEYLQRS